MRIAIVGSQGKHWTPVGRTKAILKIKEILIDDDYLDVNPFDPGDVSYPILISGGCGATGEDDKQKFDGGIDVWAEIVADFIGLEKDIKYAETFDWQDKTVNIQHSHGPGDPDSWLEKVKRKGFKTRNIEIAYDCEVLFCIEPKVPQGTYKAMWSEEHGCFYRRSGGMWTLEYAEKLGREVHVVVIE